MLPLPSDNISEAINSLDHCLDQLGHLSSGDGDLHFRGRILDRARSSLSQLSSSFQNLEQERIKGTHYDELTQLPKRHLLLDRLSQMLAQARRNRTKVAVMVLAMDRFNHVVDALGNDVGDWILADVARRLVGLLREGDTVAIFPNDRFVVALPALQDVKQAAKLAQKLLEGMSRPFFLGEQKFHFTANVGITIYPDDEVSGEYLVANAISAMERSRKNLPGSFEFHHPEMNSVAVEKLALENNLHRAIDHGEFLVYYQPQVNMRTGHIVGAEALLRWLDPIEGVVSPGKFIPLAEETGLIIGIGEWVLRSVCEQAVRWHKAGHHKVPIAVNLSARQLQRDDFADFLEALLEETGLDPKYLELELTEYGIVQNVERARTMMQRMKALGVHLSIDDFGTGWSSLAQLKRFPIDTLKIDKSFLDDLAKRPSENSLDAIIIRWIIGLAHGLDLRVIAEGVETQEQLDILFSMQCSEIQGYLFSRPLPAHEFEKLLQRQNSPTVD